MSDEIIKSSARLKIRQRRLRCEGYEVRLENGPSTFNICTWRMSSFVVISDDRPLNGGCLYIIVRLGLKDSLDEERLMRKAMANI